MLNQDNTVNSPSNPAARGTIVQIFATGGNQSIPSSSTGSVTPVRGGGQLRLPVKVTIGGYDARSSSPDPPLDSSPESSKSTR